MNIKTPEMFSIFHNSGGWDKMYVEFINCMFPIQKMKSSKKVLFFKTTRLLEKM